MSDECGKTGRPAIADERADLRSFPLSGAIAIAIFIFLLLAVVPGPLPLGSHEEPARILGWIGARLEACKDSISGFSSVVTAVGVWFAALTFLRAQRMNRANMVYDKLKDAREMMAGISEFNLRKMSEIMSFYSSIYLYYHYRLVTKMEWVLFEKDMSNLVRSKEYKMWLGNNSYENQAALDHGEYGKEFASYLKKLESRPADTKGNR